MDADGTRGGGSRLGQQREAETLNTAISSVQPPLRCPRESRARKHPPSEQPPPQVPLLGAGLPLHPPRRRSVPSRPHHAALLAGPASEPQPRSSALAADGTLRGAVLLPAGRVRKTPRWWRSTLAARPLRAAPRAALTLPRCCTGGGSSLRDLRL